MSNLSKLSNQDIIGILEKSKSLTEAILDSSSFIFFVIDATGKLYRVNNETAKLFNCFTEYAPGRTIDEFISEESAHRIFRSIERLSESTNERSQIEIECFGSSDFPFYSKGVKRTILVEVQSLNITIENLNLFTVTGSDVTEFRERLRERADYENQIKLEQSKSRRLNLILAVNEFQNSNNLDAEFKKLIKEAINLTDFSNGIYWNYEINEKKLTARVICKSENSNVLKIEQGMQISNIKAYPLLNNILTNQNIQWISNGQIEDKNNVIRTQVAVPVKYENQLYGIIELQGENLIPEEADLIDTLTEVGQKLGLSMYQRELEAQIKEKNIQLQVLSKLSALGEISGGIAHEINNPLRIISGRIKIITGLISSGKFEKNNLIRQLEYIQSTVDRIANIIKGLRVFSRDNNNAKFQIVSLHEVLNSTSTLINERIVTKKIRFIVEPIPALHFFGNGPQMVQVLLNLLNNSCDAVADLDDRWVEISFSENEKEFQIIITDSGTSISEEIANKIMVPFFTTKEPGKGTGLGLSVSFGIIRNHKGTIQLNQKNPHTQFIITLAKYIDSKTQSAS